MIKNVFFDLDGTLVNTEPGIMAGLAHCMHEYGYELPDYETMKTCIGPPFSWSFPRIFHVTDEDYQAVLNCYRSFYDDGGVYMSELYDGIEPLLQALVKRGYSLNICSSKPEQVCKKLLAHLGVDKYFSDIVGATPDGRIDSKQQVIEECFRRAPWKQKDETILVGDTKFDAIGAAAYGIDCICVSWGFDSNEALLDAGAIAVFDDCSEVLDYIERN